MSSIRIVRNDRGDDEAHRDGCQHIARMRRPWGVSERDQTFTAGTFIEAVIEADTDMAAAFGQTVYQPDASDQPWTVSVMAAPCLIKALRAEGVRTFNTETGQPEVTH